MCQSDIISIRFPSALEKAVCKSLSVENRLVTKDSALSIVTCVDGWIGVAK